MMETNYKNPTDLLALFNTKKTVDEFFIFMINKYFFICESLEEATDKSILHPIIYDENINGLQIDYVFFVWMLGSFYAEKRNDLNAINKIIIDFGFSYKDGEKFDARSNRKLLVYFFELFYKLITHGNYKVNMNYFSVFKPKIYEIDDNFIEFKSVTFNKIEINNILNIESLLASNPEYFYHENATQIAFGARKVSDFWNNSETKKNNLLHIGSDDLDLDLNEDFIVQRILFNYKV